MTLLVKSECHACLLLLNPSEYLGDTRRRMTGIAAGLVLREHKRVDPCGTSLAQ